MSPNKYYGVRKGVQRVLFSWAVVEVGGGALYSALRARGFSVKQNDHSKLVSIYLADQFPIKKSKLLLSALLKESGDREDITTGKQKFAGSFLEYPKECTL